MNLPEPVSTAGAEDKARHHNETQKHVQAVLGKVVLHGFSPANLIS